MEEQLVGFRFHPTEEELLNYYLKNKILGESFVNKVIAEININDHDPESLRSLSKIKSDDRTLFFTTRTVFMSSKSTSRKRCTKSGSWKPSGEDREIKDKNGNLIGLKKTLVYRKRGTPKNSKKKKSSWIMHEYHIKDWSHPDMESYVICKIKDKREEVGEPSQSQTVKIEQEPVVEEDNGLSLEDLEPPMPIMNQPDEEFDLNTFFNDLEPPMPIMNQPDEEFDLNTFLSENDFGIPMIEPEVSLQHVQNNDVTWDSFDHNTWFNDQELEMQEHRNVHKPNKPLQGIIVDSDSDSDNDAESISITSYQGTSSPGDSDTETQLTRCIIPSNQEVVYTEKKKGLFVTKEAMKNTNKNPMKMMIFGLILMMALIGIIVVVLSSTVKT